MTAREIAALFETIAPLDSGIEGDQLGFVWGNPDIEVTGIGCMWSVQVSSIEYCIKHDINFIISHERLWLPPQESPWYDAPQPQQRFSMKSRSELLAKHNITVYRSHSNWDALPKFGISDSAVTTLNIWGLKEIARRKFFSVQELHEPIPTKLLYHMTMNSFGFRGCRLFGDKEKMIQRFAILIGGFGENQLHMPQAAVELGAEVLIIGEMSEFIVLTCMEMGIPVIETLHSVSEIPGIKRQAKIVAERIPDLPVMYVPSGLTAYR